MISGLFLGHYVTRRVLLHVTRFSRVDFATLDVHVNIIQVQHALGT
jgi:hypothetical protein